MNSTRWRRQLRHLCYVGPFVFCNTSFFTRSVGYVILFVELFNCTFSCGVDEKFIHFSLFILGGAELCFEKRRSVHEGQSHIPPLENGGKTIRLDISDACRCACVWQRSKACCGRLARRSVNQRNWVQLHMAKYICGRESERSLKLVVMIWENAS